MTLFWWFNFDTISAVVWEQRKLNRLTDKVKSYPLSRCFETANITETRYIHYGDIHTRKAQIIKDTSELPNIMPGKFIPLHKGDVVLADASEDYQDIAAPAIFWSDSPKSYVVAGLHTIALRPLDELFPFFLYYSIKAPNFRHYGYLVGQGLKVFGISEKNIGAYLLNLPSVEEQQSISRTIQTLETMIASNQRQQKRHTAFSGDLIIFLLYQIRLAKCFMILSLS